MNVNKRKQLGAAALALVAVVATGCGDAASTARQAPEGWQTEWCAMDWPEFSLATAHAVGDHVAPGHYAEQGHLTIVWGAYYRSECAA